MRATHDMALKDLSFRAVRLMGCHKLERLHVVQGLMRLRLRVLVRETDLEASQKNLRRT